MGPIQKDEIMVAILIDALGWEIVEHFGFARRLLGRSAPLDTVLGYSSAAIPSLLTGEAPSVHGAWSMYRFAPRQSPFRWLRYLPRPPHPLEWRLRRLIRWVVDRRGSVRGHFDLYSVPLDVLGYFDLALRADPYETGSLRHETLFDRFETEKLPFKVWTYRSPEASNFSDLKTSLAAGCGVYFLYTAELDALMHRVGTTDIRVGERLKDYENHIEELMRRARDINRRMRIYLFSDHGMTDVTMPVDLWHEVEKWGFRPGRDFMVFYDSTMARFWCGDDAKAELTRRLEATGWGSVLSDADLKSLGCFFKDRSYGEVIFLADPGVLIVPSFMGDDALAAMHGYHPRDRHSKGCFLTNDAGCSLPSSILQLKQFLVSRALEGA